MEICLCMKTRSPKVLEITSQVIDFEYELLQNVSPPTRSKGSVRF